VRIRLAAETDASQILKIYTPVVVGTPISFEETSPSPAEMAGRIRRTLDHYPWLVCDGDEGITGYAYATAFRPRAAYQWSVEVSAYVHTESRRRGIARGLYTSLFEILRIQGFVNAFAGIALPNEGSVALHESLGFTAIGVYEAVGFKLESWHDVGWWQLRLGDPDSPPPQLHWFAELRGSEAVAKALAEGEAQIRP
jgi:phosphinothricin acetyltransferase